MSSRFGSGTLVSLALIVAACGGTTSNAVPSPTPRVVLNSAEQSELRQLEARPLKLPPLAADGSCPETPMTTIKPYKNQFDTIELYGPGPVYGIGGPETDSTKNAYFNVTYLADPDVHGVVLIRIQTLDGIHMGVFVGSYGTGPVVGTDRVDGKTMDLYGIAILTTLRSSTDPAYAEGWKLWRVRQGIDRSFKCVGIQIDIDSDSEIIVVAG